MTSITGTVDGLTNPSYSYDANGNLTCTSSGSGCSGTIGRTVNMTSFNMAASMGQGSNSLNLTYDDQHQRIQQVNTVSGTATTRTVYINDAVSGAMSERVTASGTTPTVWNSFNWNAAPWGGVTASALPTFTDYITIDGQVVAQRKVTYPAASAWMNTPAGCTPSTLGPCIAPKWNSFNWGPPVGSVWTNTPVGCTPATPGPCIPPKWNNFTWTGNVVAWNYFNLDHLGSVAVITDQGGNVLQRLSFDAWGKQRNANGTSASCGTITSTTTRGFTNQEEMPTQCLVNLNARLYDASIGKFMAADSIVPDPFNGQSYNRYAYVTNNPLSFTDPSGHDRFGMDQFCAFCSTIILQETARGTIAIPVDAGSKSVTPNSLNSQNQSYQFNGNSQNSGGARGFAGYSESGRNLGSSGGVEQVERNATRYFSNTSVVFFDPQPQTISLPDANKNSSPSQTTPRHNQQIPAPSERNKPTAFCPVGRYRQMSLGAGFDLGFLIPGVSASASIGASIPPGGDFLNGGQVFGDIQVTGTLGVGLHGGVGGSGSYATSDGPMKEGVAGSASVIGRVDVMGGGMSGTINGSGHGYSVPIPTGRLGLGVGAYVGGGVALDGTLASPTIGCSPGN